ncbi:MAG: AAA family ATPase [Gallionella sp.]|nr:AAA family ATPase [Gallionella sp.]
MYLEFFGLKEAPFRITPITEFFFSGADRGEILDALVYSVSEAEGIIKVSGEVGSGKTMLCRMLLERLPTHIETIYLSNPSVSREEMLYAIADGLGLRMEKERVGIIMQNIQKKLLDTARQGKRVVVLVDEAHAMPIDTLEELRLLYNLQVGSFKLIQIILFGQPELNDKLEQPNMRQLKDRILHHFNIQPLSGEVVESYLMFRLRTAGYHGPNIFSDKALNLIANTSGGLMRRANVLADKALLSAFIEGTHNIDARHVQAAIADSDLKTKPPKKDKKLRIVAAVLLLTLVTTCAWWMLGRTTQTWLDSSASAAAQPTPVAIPQAQTAPQVEDLFASTPIAAIERTENASFITTIPLTRSIPAPPALSSATQELPLSLFEQRLAASKQLLAQKKIISSIQLFSSEETRAEKIEGFLKRAEKLGKLSEIYLIPSEADKRHSLRVAYGAYPSIEAARQGITTLPARYQESFAISLIQIAPTRIDSIEPPNQN